MVEVELVVAEVQLNVLDAEGGCVGAGRSVFARPKEVVEGDADHVGDSFGSVAVAAEVVGNTQDPNDERDGNGLHASRRRV